MKITIVYPNWRLLRKRADDAFYEARSHGMETNAHDFYMACTMRGEDVSAEHPDAYEMVYNEELQWDEELTDFQVLERLFEMFNIGDHGGRRDLRSMSVGDQVALADSPDTEARVYVCKPCGWDRL